LSAFFRARIQQLLRAVADGTTSPEEAVGLCSELVSSKLEYSVIDEGRETRTGMPEVIFGEGKTVSQLRDIVQQFSSTGRRFLATRVCQEQVVGLQSEEIGLEYDPVSRLLWLGSKKGIERSYEGRICVVCAGTSDIAVAEEAAASAEWLGAEVNRIWDVGVAGLHRLLERLTELREAKVVIVVAGMEGALPSVVAGLIASPVIAVPTSIGYGTNLGGLTPMLAMMTGCSTGVTVVNIDNGFGAASAAIRMMERVS
jgi:pyridinium-3,5-biscarboxylic acid mononucleotide synthase